MILVLPVRTIILVPALVHTASFDCAVLGHWGTIRGRNDGGNIGADRDCLLCGGRRYLGHSWSHKEKLVNNGY
jgi:hypothetical protein